MRRGFVIAVTNPIADEAAVRAVARPVARMLQGDVVDLALPVPLFATGAADARATLVRRARGPNVAAVVVDGPGRPDDALRPLTIIACPVVFAPAGTPARYHLRHLLAPLDGTADAACAIAATATRALRVGLQVTVLHCSHGAALPWFEDRPQYDTAEWAREFAARHPAVFDDSGLELRVGPPGEQTLEVARAIGADLIVLGWNRRPEPDRSMTVRFLLAQSAIPIMLLPIGPPS